jgi:hypothetical protein
MKQFKIGDIVVVTKRHHENSAVPGNIVELVSIDENTNIPYLVNDFLNMYNWEYDYSQWCRDVRFPTIEELKSIGMINDYEIY